MSVDKPFGMAEVKQEGGSVAYDKDAGLGGGTAYVDTTTAEELVAELKECINSGLWFEICTEHAKLLWDYIENLQMAAEDDRGVL